MTLLLGRVGILLLPLLAFLGARMESAPGGNAEALANGRVTHVRGTLAVPALRISRDEVLVVDDDAVIESLSTIIIEGRIQVVDRELGARSRHGATLELRAAIGIHVAAGAEILGGRGQNLDHDAGFAGVGSHITLHAPVTWIDGRVEAGPGGNCVVAVSDNRGGAGGSVDVFGHYFTHRSNSEYRPGERGIVGGMGGYPGGNGGDAMAHCPPLGSNGGEWNPFDAQVDSGPEGIDLSAVPYESECPAGTDGNNGGASTGGAGLTGNPGANGSSSSPNGQPGLVGGAGGNITGGHASAGTVGGNCCSSNPTTGGKGGKGGKGGTGTGGPGGTGGRGGNGYESGNGGNGGAGGSAGTGTGGNGGNGGPGGPHQGPGGDPGEPGQGGGGAVGAGGQGGDAGPSGGTPGNQGVSGGDGGTASGNWGNPGATGASCPGIR